MKGPAAMSDDDARQRTARTPSTDLVAGDQEIERAVGTRQRHVRRQGHRRHLRVRRPGHPDRLPRRLPAAVRRLVRRGRRRARGAAEGHRPRRRRSRRSSSTAARSPSSSAARTCPSSRRCCATTRSSASSSAPGVSGVHYPDDAGRELHAVYHLLSMTHNRRIRLEVTCPDADPHIPSLVASTRPTTGTSARPSTSSASLRRPPGPDPHPDARRLARPPAAQGLPLGRHPRGVQGRHDPAARPAEVLQLMTHRTCTPTRARPARAGSSPSPARTGTRSPRDSATPTRSGSSSTWVRSTPRPTACCA